MRRWDPLSERQLLVLRRVNGGDDLSGPDGVTLRTSARSLQSRGLVAVSRRGGRWRATVTDAGRFYLERGYHPDRPDADLAGGQLSVTGQQRGNRPPSTVPARATPTQPPSGQAEAARLIDRLRDADGTLTIESPDDETRARYRRAIHAAKQHKLIPEGFHLRHTGRASGDLIISLSDDKAPDDTGWNRIRLNARRVTSDPSLVLAAVEKDHAGLNVTEVSVPRALDLLRGLAEEARRHGFRLGVNTKSVRSKLFLQIDRQTQRSVTVHEEYDEVPHVLSGQEKRQLRREPWRRPRELDMVPSGRLQLQVARAGWNTGDSWTDEKRSPLEKRLPRILRDIKAGVAADEEARLAAERAHEARLAEWRRQEEEQQREWQTALDEAHPKAAESVRRKTFRAAYDAWVAACEIRAFCEALEHTGHDDVGDWIAWGHAAADRIDPTQGDGSLSDAGFHVTPSPDDLRPFLGEWNPREPRREYRSERDQERLKAERVDAEDWHVGMRGRPTWWKHR